MASGDRMSVVQISHLLSCKIIIVAQIYVISIYNTACFHLSVNITMYQNIEKMKIEAKQKN